MEPQEMETQAEALRALIVDDEPLARRTLRDLLAADPEIGFVSECGDGFTALELLQAHAPDLVFLDVQMPELSGFEVVEAFGVERFPPVVFVTAYDRYALRAFEVQALDYLLKPFDDARFARTLARAKAQVRQRASNQLRERLQALWETKLETKPETKPETKLETPTAPHWLTRLMIKSGGRVFFLNVAEIDWIEAADYYVQLHVGGKTHLLRETLSELETRLAPDQFLRIHRSAIVNVERIQALQPNASGACAVLLHDGTTLKLSRHRRAKIEATLLNR